MAMHRRQLLQRCRSAILFSAFASARQANAQSYPSRPIRWIISFAAGGGNDIVARVMAPFLTGELGQQIIVEDRAGAGGNIGMAAVLASAPDGYTIGYAAPNNAINATLYDKLPFDFIRDSVPVAGTMRLANVMVVHPSLPTHTVAEFIDYAKANPGKLYFASSGTGASPHMSGELFKAMTGVDIVHVPYRGAGPAMSDLIPGRVQLMFDNLPSSIPHIRSGELRALGVTSAKRSAALPDVPAIAETVPGYEVDVWNGIVAPRGTSPEIIARLNRAVNTVLSEPRLLARFAELGGTPMPMRPEEFGALLSAEVVKWAKVVKFAGIKPE
ncbi:MAG TPA: tripartite tricarboxylate transporter substrate binding protein [Xanthobacteraceae bacterium]|nr:tripartite tricarboxylate transporter substrate binding protein [Xanthobacteraceae bacterium]